MSSPTDNSVTTTDEGGAVKASGNPRGSRPNSLGATTVRALHSKRIDAELSGRQVLESHFGRSITNAEWARMRSKLIEFAMILRDWDRKAGPEVGNVETYASENPD